MKAIYTVILFMWYGITFGQTKSGYEIHTCKSGQCAVLSFSDTQPRPMKAGGLGAWCEPIRVSVGVQEGLSISNSEIEAAIAEDSEIAIEDGLYTGDGPAYILSYVFSYSPEELTNKGFPFIVNSVSAAFSSIDYNGNGPQLGTIYDTQVLEARECHGAQMMYIIVNDNTSGVQETATNGVAPDEKRNPTIVCKEGAFQVNARNHGITHASGQNHPDHQDGPDVSKRPIEIGNDKSYGWSTTGFGGFSGGNALGIGPNGEDLAGHVADGFVSWLALVPNLSAELSSFPLEMELNDIGIFEATVNKDIGNENWEWTFTNGNTVLTETGSSISRSFDVPGVWTYEVLVANDCGGQSFALAGDFVVNGATMTAPIANCQNITVFLDEDGSVTVPASAINNGSSDPDGDIVSVQIDNAEELSYTCSDLGTDTVALSATDNDGLSSSCQAIVTIADNIFPSLECRGNINILLADNQDTTLLATDLLLTATDNCNYTATASQENFSGEAPGTYAITVSAIDASGNATTCDLDITIEQTSAVINIAHDDRISIYPNPTTDAINIKLDGQLLLQKILLYSPSGRLIIESTATQQLSLHDLAKGQYQLKIITNTEVFVTTIIKN